MGTILCDQHPTFRSTHGFPVSDDLASRESIPARSNISFHQPVKVGTSEQWNWLEWLLHKIIYLNTHTHIFIYIYIHMYIYVYIYMIILWYILYIYIMTSWRTPSKTWERVQFLNPQTNGTCLKEFPEIVSFVTKPICWAVRIEPLDLSGPVSKQVLWNYSDQCHAQLVASKNGQLAIVVHVSRKPVQRVFWGSDHILFLYGILEAQWHGEPQKKWTPQKYWQNGTGPIDKVTNVSIVKLVQNPSIFWWFRDDPSK